MKREILFRGKDEKGGWHYGDLVVNRPTQSFRIFSDFANVKHGNFTENGLHECSGELHLVVPETVGQFTGMLDKNGVKIFEDDIVKARYFPIGADKKVIEYYKIGLVIWHQSLMLKKEGTKVLNHKKALSHHKDKEEVYYHPNAGLDWIDRSGLLYNELTILGNIHDNPELLK